MGNRAARLAGWAMPVVYLLAVVTHAVLEARLAQEGGPVTVELLVLYSAFGWFALLGGLVVARRPRNAMGWLLGVTGLLFGVFAASHAIAAHLYLATGHGSVVIALLAWPNVWYWYALLVVVVVVVPLLFPTGRLPSSRWRIALWVPVGAATVIAVLSALRAEIDLYLIRSHETVALVSNPIGVPGLAQVEELAVFGPLSAVLVAGIVAGVAALIVRFRRSRGVERQQVKWLLAAVALMPLVALAEVLPVPDLVGSIGFALVVNAIPLAIGLAVLRFRLYDIDRLISRTATYALVVGVLAALYAATVVALQVLLAPVASGSDLAVAGSTLTVAALFRPLRGRVRSAVDRRFDRARYDAHRTAEEFARRLRDEVDLDALTDDLREVVVATLRPRQSSVWLGPGVTR
jgi:hypothetical protein